MIKSCIGFGGKHKEFADNVYQRFNVIKTLTSDSKVKLHIALWGA